MIVLIKNADACLQRGGTGMEKRKRVALCIAAVILIAALVLFAAAISCGSAHAMYFGIALVAVAVFAALTAVFGRQIPLICLCLVLLAAIITSASGFSRFRTHRVGVYHPLSYLY